MTEWLRKIIVPTFDDEELNSRAFNLNVVLLVLFVAILLGIVAMSFQIGQRPLLYVLPNVAFLVVAALVLVLCYYLSRKGYVQAGSVIFVAMLTVACLGAIAVGGTLGGLPAILIIPVAIAGVTLGSRASVFLAVLGMLILVIVGLLEINGFIVVEYPASEMTILLNMFDIGFGLFFATMGIWLAGYSLRIALQRTRQANVEAEQYRQDLEQSLTAEQAIRDRLQRAIDEYTVFLERLGQGDYEARLSLAEEDQSLGMLEQQINATVDTLVTALGRTEEALQQAEEAYRQYILQEWRRYMRTLPATDFEAAQPGVRVQSERFQPALEKALVQQQMVTLASQDNGETGGQRAYAVLGAPIRLRDEVIGILGICREGGAGDSWTEAEQTLIAAVTERLALAADNIRLLEDVQHRAAREQLIGEVATRMRESLDINTVLQTAVREIGESLGLHDVTIQLEMDGAQDGQDGAKGENRHV